MQKSYFVLLFVFFIPFFNPLTASDQLISELKISMEQKGEKSIKQKLVKQIKSVFEQRDDPKKRNNSLLGALALISAILGFVLFATSSFVGVVLGVVLGITAFFLGLFGLKRDKKRGLAIAGMVLGSIAVIMVILAFFILASIS